MCATGLGKVPANFNVVTKGVPAGAGTKAKWEVYAKAHMFTPETSPKL